MNNQTVVGRFYLKKTSNGNLIGEFSHHSSVGNATESCDFREEESREMRKDANDHYVGIYHSTWCESETAIFAVLTITKKNDKIFTLEWRGKAGKIMFTGEGMLCDDILIGDYHSGQ